jgi:DNA topoisomerase IA
MVSRMAFTARVRAEGGNKAAKLKAIREALRTAKRVWLATDCDREGQRASLLCPNESATPLQ